MPMINSDAGVCYRQPKKLDSRIRIAKEYVERFNFQLPFFVDCMENETMMAYSSLPERLYVVEDGKVIYEGGPGPFAYSPAELEQFLQKYLA